MSIPYPRVPRVSARYGTEVARASESPSLPHPAFHTQPSTHPADAVTQQGPTLVGRAAGDRAPLNRICVDGDAGSVAVPTPHPY